jgi:hypothetical protein
MSQPQEGTQQWFRVRLGRNANRALMLGYRADGIQSYQGLSYTVLDAVQ